MQRSPLLQAWLHSTYTSPSTRSTPTPLFTAVRPADRIAACYYSGLYGLTEIRKEYQRDSAPQPPPRQGRAWAAPRGLSPRTCTNNAAPPAGSPRPPPPQPPARALSPPEEPLHPRQSSPQLRKRPPAAPPAGSRSYPPPSGGALPAPSRGALGLVVSPSLTGPRARRTRRRSELQVPACTAPRPTWALLPSGKSPPSARSRSAFAGAALLSAVPHGKGSPAPRVTPRKGRVPALQLPVCTARAPPFWALLGDADAPGGMVGGGDWGAEGQLFTEGEALKGWAGARPAEPSAMQELLWQND